MNTDRVRLELVAGDGEGVPQSWRSVRRRVLECARDETRSCACIPPGGAIAEEMNARPLAERGSSWFTVAEVLELEDRPKEKQ